MDLESHRCIVNKQNVTLFLCVRGYGCHATHVLHSSNNHFPKANLFDYKTGCQFHITSAFPWCCSRCPWATCPATACTASRKRTYFPYRCHAIIYGAIVFCLFFCQKFNLISAIFGHQSSALPQKIDSREGLFWCKRGLVCACGKMNFYLERPPFAPVFGLFAAKCGAFWC